MVDERNNENSQSEAVAEESDAPELSQASNEASMAEPVAASNESETAEAGSPAEVDNGTDETDGAKDTATEDDASTESPEPENSTAESKAKPSNESDGKTNEGMPVEGNDDDEVTLPLWYILKVQVNREDSIREALLRRVKMEGLEEHFLDVVVPTEDVVEFTKSGKRRVVKRKLYPGYILANMVINDETWFVVRETPGVGDFTGSAGTPTPMDPKDVERILRSSEPDEEGVAQPKTAIPFKPGERVRVKDGNFQNFEGEVESIDETHGRVIVVIQIFSRPTPVELEHWQIEAV